MNKKRAHLAERRSQLVAQSAAQRTALAHDLAPWRARLALADQGVAALRFIRRHPAVMVGAALLAAALLPRRFAKVGKWLRPGWAIWKIGRRLRRT